MYLEPWSELLLHKLIPHILTNRIGELDNALYVTIKESRNVHMCFYKDRWGEKGRPLNAVLKNFEKLIWKLWNDFSLIIIWLHVITLSIAWVGCVRTQTQRDFHQSTRELSGRLQKELWETTFYNLTHHSTAIVTDAPGDLSVFASAAGTQLWFSKALTLLRVAITARDDTVLGRFPLFYWLPAIDKPETKENWAGIVARESNLKEILMQESSSPDASTSNGTLA